MLKSMRRNIKRLHFMLWAVIITFIGAYAFLWGTDEKKPGEGESIAQVNNVPIYRTAFEQKKSNIQQRYARVYGESYEQFASRMDFNQIAFDTLVEEILLDEEANRLGIRVFDGEVESVIKNDASFSVGNRFSPARYREILSYMGMKPEYYEEQIRRVFVTGKFHNIYETFRA